MSPRKNPAAVALGKLSGKVWTDAKRAASRKNGKRGGRPQKHLASCLHVEGVWYCAADCRHHVVRDADTRKAVR